MYFTSVDIYASPYRTNPENLAGKNQSDHDASARSQSIPFPSRCQLLGPVPPIVSHPNRKTHISLPRGNAVGDGPSEFLPFTKNGVPSYTPQSGPNQKRPYINEIRGGSMLA
jgi:hypothetical protein